MRLKINIWDFGFLAVNIEFQIFIIIWYYNLFDLACKLHEIMDFDLYYRLLFWILNIMVDPATK